MDGAMQQIQLGDQIIRYDHLRTRAAYAVIENGSAERCGCPYCRNFIAQRDTLYPESFRVLLDQLGIDAEKEGEVYEYGTDLPTPYGGWFYLAGELIEPGERMTDAGRDFQYFFRRSHIPNGIADFGDEVLALEFTTRLSWVIPESRDVARP
jgi:hypothetical protein